MTDTASTEHAFGLRTFAGMAGDSVDAAVAEAFRNSMAGYPAVVNIITTGTDEDRRGFTASAVFSVSLSPPLIGVCVNKGVDAHPHLLANGYFCVNVLHTYQEAIANRFAARDGSKGALRFAQDDWDELETGAPALVGSTANVDCDLAAALDVGTHTIMFGRVLAVRAGEGVDPLLYFQRQFAGAHVLRNSGVPLAVGPIDGW
ncbi:MAG: flavin reductase [Hyphomicrobiaceae bacterium]|nr:flavin reductase [Hyphomicrobiaceae bacterium]